MDVQQIFFNTLTGKLWVYENYILSRQEDHRSYSRCRGLSPGFGPFLTTLTRLFSDKYFTSF